MGLFGKDAQQNPKEHVREWTRKLRQEQRALERQVHGIQREEQKVTKSLKEAAKKGDRDVCKVLAKEIVRSRKAVTKLYVSKAQINSVILNMDHQVANIRMAGALQRSTEVMRSMSSLVRIPEIQATMRELSKEMMKAGIIEEMIEDTMESMEPEEMEEEAEAEVERILWEVTQGELGRAPAPIEAELEEESEKKKIGAKTALTSPQPKEDLDEMRARLEALRS